MSDLSTSYLGLSLKNPLVVSPSPLCEDLGAIRKMEDASAVVLHSLFEEQLSINSQDLDRFLTSGTESFAEALSYFPDMGQFKLGPEAYLEHIQKAKKAVKIPIIGSLNGVSTGGWVSFAKKIEQAGADALELNVYYIATDPDMSGPQVEQMYADLVRDGIAESPATEAEHLPPLIHGNNRIHLAACPGTAFRLGVSFFLCGHFYSPCYFSKFLLNIISK